MDEPEKVPESGTVKTPNFHGMALKAPGGLLTTANDRITVQHSITLEHIGDEPLQIRANFDYLTETREEYYTRRLTVEEGKWKPLPLGDMEEHAGRIIIFNNAGRNLQKPPTQPEAEEIKKQILLVSLCGASHTLRILPRQLLDFMPSDPTQVQIASTHGSISCRVYVLPR